MEKIIFDSFALIAFFRKEKAGLTTKAYLYKAARKKSQIYLSYINLAEVYYQTIRNQGLGKGKQVLATIKSFPLVLVSAADDLVLEAAEIKAKYPIALSDCFAAALALKEKAPILTGDPEFKKLEEIVKIKWL